MLLFIIKVIGMFAIAIVVLRLMGKSTLAQVTPHDLVAIVMVAALATQPILDKSFGKTMVAIAVVALIHILFAKLTLYKWTSHLFMGEPTILVKHGKIIKKNLRRSEISLSELLATVRTKGYPDIREVQYAILESTGSISMLPRDELYPATPRELGVDVPYRGLALSLIVDGQIQASNLQLIGKEPDWLKKELQKKGYNDLSKVMYAATLDNSFDIYVDNGSGERA